MKKKIDFRLDEKLIESLDNYAIALSTTRTAALERLITDHCWIDTQVAKHTIPDDLDAIRQNSGPLLDRLRNVALLRDVPIQAATTVEGLSKPPRNRATKPVDQPKEEQPIRELTYEPFDD